MQFGTRVGKKAILRKKNEEEGVGFGMGRVLSQPEKEQLLRDYLKIKAQCMDIVLKDGIDNEKKKV